MKKRNFKRYDSSHWSEITNEEIALDKYLDRYSDVYNSNNLERFIKLIPDQSRKLKILDYGGGCGLLACKVAELSHSVVLADQSQFALNAAQLLASKLNVKIQTVCTQDCKNLPANEFDIIFLKDLIEHVVEDETLIKDMSSLLTPDGIICISTQNFMSPNYFIEGAARKIKNPFKPWLGWDRTHLRFYSPKSLKRLLNNANLSVTGFNSAYIFPYKLLLLLPFKKRHLNWLYSIGFSLDNRICKSGISQKIGWNLMIIGRREKN